jgi:hypothetical protein
MTRSKRGPGAGSRRRDRLIREREHDIYKARSKLPEPTACPECGAVYQKGRWQWITPNPSAHETLCPACRRIHDRCPAGYLTLDGSFLPEHEAEILHLAHNVEAREKGLHPMRRIIAVEKQGEAVLVTTTEMDLARAIGEAIHNAYHGDLNYRYSDETNILHVHWSR